MNTAGSAMHASVTSGARAHIVHAAARKRIAACLRVPRTVPRRLALLALLLGGLSTSALVTAGTPDRSARSRAAAATANGTANACAAIRPFYWEIGDAHAALAAGSVNTVGDTSAQTYTAGTPMAIASASKWLFGAWVVQETRARLTQEHIALLDFTSGHTGFRRCRHTDTVAGCQQRPGNDGFDADAIGKFSYGGGHMQRLAVQLGLGDADNTLLASRIERGLGGGLGLVYTQPQLAGGATMSAEGYARFLRRLLRGELLLGGMLDAAAVPADPAMFPSQALKSPAPAGSGWYYGLGHWIEGMPGTPQAVSSSAGAFGFYPWVSADRKWYGIVARREFALRAGMASAACGALIRNAWLDGVTR